MIEIQVSVRVDDDRRGFGLLLQSEPGSMAIAVIRSRELIATLKRELQATSQGPDERDADPPDEQSGGF